MKTKHELRQEAVERLKETMKRHPVSLTNEYIVNALVGYDNWLTTVSDDAESIIDLLTDDDDMEGHLELPLDADGEVIHRCHKPTVEDVLCEFAVTMSERMHLSNGVATTIAEYAPRLKVSEVE